MKGVWALLNRLLSWIGEKKSRLLLIVGAGVLAVSLGILASLDSNRDNLADSNDHEWQQTPSLSTSPHLNNAPSPSPSPSYTDSPPLPSVSPSPLIESEDDTIVEATAAPGMPAQPSTGEPVTPPKKDSSTAPTTPTKPSTNQTNPPSEPQKTTYYRVLYDDFESGASGLWRAATGRSMPVVVSQDHDGSAKPRSGSRYWSTNYNGTVAWNAADRYQTAELTLPKGSTEVLVRMWVRIGNNVDTPRDSTGPKFAKLGTYTKHEVYLAYSQIATGRLFHAGNASGVTVKSYWGDSKSELGREWNKVEWYARSGAEPEIKLWVNDVLVHTAAPTLHDDLAEWGPFAVNSNWSGGAEGSRDHDETNHFYYDDIEVFSNAGTGSTVKKGTLRDGDASI